MYNCNTHKNEALAFKCTKKIICWIWTEISPKRKIKKSSKSSCVTFKRCSMEIDQRFSKPKKPTGRTSFRKRKKRKKSTGSLLRNFQKVFYGQISKGENRYSYKLIRTDYISSIIINRSFSKKKTKHSNPTPIKLECFT